jgi:DNA-binding IclR family transcriptional regulator
MHLVPHESKNELVITCVAIPITGLSGQPVALISTPGVYMTWERISDLVALLNSPAPQITSCLPPRFKDSRE